MFDQVQNVEDSYVGTKLYHVYIWLWIGLVKVEHELELPHFIIKYSKTLN
jgi:hypothetical protein